MLQLAVKSGPRRGAAWPLSATVQRIGRHSASDIRVTDRLTSRQHCEVWAKGEEAYVRSLAAHNITLVNGQPVEEARLQPGDELGVGGVVFVVLGAGAAPLDDADAGLDETDDTPSLRWAPLLLPHLQHPEAAPPAASVRDLTELLAMGRAFNEAEHVSELMGLLMRWLEKRFAPSGVWLGSRRTEDEGLALFPLEGGAPHAEAPRDPMVLALDKGKGSLVHQPEGTLGGPGVVTTLTAPLVYGKQVYGALALQAQTPQRQYDEDDLRYLIAVADTFAPHWPALERAAQLRRDVERYRRKAGVATDLVGRSKPMQRLRQTVRKAAESNLNVIVFGETGAGKELVARRVHDLSTRSEGPFVVVNCAALPGELFESEMFGYERGAFTGASQRKIGCFEEAHGGTLFLDEVSDLTPENQARLLRAIDQGSFRRLGGKGEVSVDVRILCASNRPIRPAGNGEGLREDLYHRLNGIEIDVPPLRDRKSDVPLLAEYFVQQFGDESVPPVRHIAPGAMKRLKEWRWPGNVRELENVIKRAVTQAEGDTIEVAHVEIDKPREGVAPDDTVPMTLREAQQRHIEKTLAACEGNIRQTARALGISRATLYKKL